jgi:CRISPR-associated protein Cas2
MVGQATTSHARKLAVCAAAGEGSDTAGIETRCSRQSMQTARDLYLAAYDVTSPRRLRAALDLVRGYATGGQYSVHECWLTPAERAQMIADAAQILDDGEDRLLLLRLDPRGAAIALGVATTPADPSCFYVA